MKERLDRRVLGAIRWLDAVTKSAVLQPLSVRSTTASLNRNLSGLFVITAANGLDKYAETFDLATLPAAEVKPDESVAISGEVHDPSGGYLSRTFSIKLPRNAAATLPHPANSIFKPIELQLLPAPNAKVMAGWAQVRLALTEKPTVKPFANVLVRVVEKAGGAVLGRGMSDSRGEALVAVPGLPLFRNGLTPTTILTGETAVRIEFIPPPKNSPLVVDWTALDTLPATAANVLTDPPALKAGGTSSLQFSVTP